MGKKRIGVKAASETSIQITFTYRGKTCRERIKLKPTPSNLTRAERHRAAILLAIDQGTFDYAATFPNSPRARQMGTHIGNAITIASWLDTWLKSRKPQLKASTYKTHRAIILNVLIPEFGHLLLTQFKRQDARTWAAKQSAGNKRIANILSILRAALSDAMDDEMIETNPLHGWTYKKNEPPRDTDSADPLDIKEQQAVCAAARSNPLLLNMVEFLLWTGVRPSEFVVLEWSDVDWVNERIHINKAMTEAAKEPEVTKTISSNRFVKLLPAALAALKRQKEHTYMQGGPIFVHPVKRTPITVQTLSQWVWVPLLRRAGVRERGVVHTRHTYASMMLSSGELVAWVSAQLGHSSIVTTIKHYARYIPDSNPDAGSAAVRQFSNVAENVADRRGIQGKK